MRLDKFLQVSRLIRRRVTAQQMCDGGRVQLNDRRAKPATPVAVGDLISLRLGPRHMRVRVLRLPVSPREAAREPVVEIVEDSRPREGS